MTLVSVIIPAYNAEKTILKTVRSVQKQTFDNLEIIIINDGSTDKTLELLSEIKDKRIKVFSYNNGGLPVARNRGVSHAVGEYITFIDADDLWTTDKLALQIAALQAHPESGVAYSWTAFIDTNDKLLYAQAPCFFDGNVYLNILVENFISSGSNILIRKQVIAAVGKYDSTLKSAEDWDYNIRLAAYCPFVLVPKYQILYRKSSGVMSSKVDVMETANLLVIERAFLNVPEDLKFLKRQSLSHVYRLFAKLHLEFSCSNNAIKEAYQKIKKSIDFYPKSLTNKETQRLLVKILLLRLFPYQQFYDYVTRVGRAFPIVQIENIELN